MSNAQAGPNPEVSPDGRYAWLKAEIASVATRKFVIIEGPPGPDGDDAVSSLGVDEVEFPPSYLEFRRDFGRSQFFRDSSGVHELKWEFRPLPAEQERA